MRGSNKSKKISWASDVNLCQVRLFLSEDSPSQVGSGAQDHLQAKSLWVSQPNGQNADDVLPPGFEGANSTTWHQINISDIPVNKWKCPPRFLLDVNWQVVAGEESNLVEDENKRALRVLEAVYPRPSAIPPNPAVIADVEKEHYDDQRTSLIPITPVEDEDSGLDTPSNFIAPIAVSGYSQPPQLSASGISPIHFSMPSVSSAPLNEPSVIAAASAALTAIAKSNEQGNMAIDHDLLAKILSNPNLIEKLVTGAIPASDPPVNFNRTENSAPAASSSGPFYPQPNGAGVGPPPTAQAPFPGTPMASPTPAAGPPRPKDINYYKNLIQQHGGERQEPPQQYGSRYKGPNQEPANNSKSRDFKPKIPRPCIFFNSSRGCRNGANCAYQHDASSQDRGNGIQEGPNAKRLKMDREISS